jgi:SSS family solute:Na+ symporter
MVLGVVAFFVIANKLGGKDSIYENLVTCSQALGFDKATRAGMSQTKFLTYMLIPLSVGMFPHIFQHWLTAKSAGAFKLPVVLHPIFIMIVWVPCVLIGAWASSQLLVDQASLPKIPGTEVPNANAILPFLVSTQAGPVLGGLLTAGILAAIMSSLDSQFLCLGTMFTTDVLVHYGGEERFSDKQQVWAARIFIIAIVVVTYLIAQLNPSSVFALGVWCFSGFTGLFPLVVAALYWRKLTKWGGYANVVATIMTWSYLFYLSGFGKNRSFTVDIPWGGETYETMSVVWITLTSTVAMVVVSWFTQPPSERTLTRFFGASQG